MFGNINYRDFVISIHQNNQTPSSMEGNVTLISYCGLYCGCCPKYQKGKCPGCEGNEKASWCKIRSCCRGKGIKSCADCDVFVNVSACRYHDSVMSNLMSVLLNSNRPAAITIIREQGYAKFAGYMAENKLITIKRRGSKFA